jgi:hypothetical protein
MPNPQVAGSHLAPASERRSEKLVGDTRFELVTSSVGARAEGAGRYTPWWLRCALRRCLMATGAPRADRRALVTVPEQVLRVAEEVPELVEFDLNPILVSPDGALAVDCKARLAPRQPGPGSLFPRCDGRRFPAARPASEAGLSPDRLSATPDGAVGRAPGHSAPPPAWPHGRILAQDGHGRAVAVGDASAGMPRQPIFPGGPPGALLHGVLAVHVSGSR